MTKEKSEKPKETPEQKKAREERESFQLLISDIHNSLKLIGKGVKQTDDRLIGRAVRQVFSMRKKIDEKILKNLFKSFNKSLLKKLNDYLSNTESMTVDDEDENKQRKTIPEVEVFLQTLLVVFLIDNKHYDDAVLCSSELVEKIQGFNRSTMNLLASKAFFYYARSYELTNKYSKIRSTLLKLFRTACIRFDNYGQAVLLNLLIRNYLSDNLYSQASKLITKSPKFDFKSNSQQARYFYYKGRIKTVQLEYSEAFNCLMEAIRKAPTTTAKGFRTASYKLSIIVKLLMGEIPEREIFEQKGLKKALQPYLALTKEVRVGNLSKFSKIVEKYQNTYKKDKTYTLIQRIRQNVIRTGLKKISVSYSRISLQDICDKLQLDSPQDVEHIVAKAIRDGIINAVIDHDGKFVITKKNVGTYSTSEPSNSYHNRIEFCMKIRHSSLKSMRYPKENEKKKEELPVYEDLEFEDDDEEDEDELY